MAGMGHMDTMMNTYNTGANTLAAQGGTIQNKMVSMPGQIATGATNVMNPRLANLGNDLAPRAMEYINDLGGNGMRMGGNIQAQSMNTMNQISHGAINALESERQLNQNYQMPGVGLETRPPSMGSQGMCGGCCDCFNSCGGGGTGCCGCGRGPSSTGIGMPYPPSQVGVGPYGYRGGSDGCFGSCCGPTGGGGGGFCSCCPCGGSGGYGVGVTGPGVQAPMPGINATVPGYRTGMEPMCGGMCGDCCCGFCN